MFSKKIYIPLSIFFYTVTGSISIVFAEPSISTIEGSLSNKSVLIVNGSEFGNGKLPILWDTTDNQPYSESLSDGGTIPTSEGLWTQNGNPWSKPIVLKKTGDLRSRYRASVYAGNTKGYLSWPHLKDSKNQNTLYVTWWFKSESSISSEGGSNKVVRVWDDGNGNNTRVSWTHHHMTADTENYQAGSSWNGWGGQTNQWNRLEIWLDGNANILKTRTNGKLIHNYKNFKTLQQLMPA